MAKDNSTIFVVGGLGVLAYYAYTQGWLSSIFGTPTSATSATTAAASTPAATTTAAQTTAVATIPPTTTTVSSSGPSLAQILAGLTAQIQSHIGSDPALVCPASGSCGTGGVTSTYDVFNWYLVAANVGVSAGPAPPDHTSQITLAQYWAWVAPILQQQMPGLAGLGNVYAGLGALVRQVKRGW